MNQAPRRVIILKNFTVAFYKKADATSLKSTDSSSTFGFAIGSLIG
jgi:hypothetical protein